LRVILIDKIALIHSEPPEVKPKLKLLKIGLKKLGKTNKKTVLRRGQVCAVLLLTIFRLPAPIELNLRPVPS
jgi:hypothetical protein